MTYLCISKKSDMKSNKISKKDILEYHEQIRPGKIEVIPTKPSNSQRDLSIAYSPGVADPCLEIEKDPANAYKYTAKGNLVAVISNGTAVLGLGNIGALASKPVMEGKSVLFKIFADIDSFDIELDTTDPERFIETVKTMAPTFGGVNLEDISAPDCFYIEKRLREEMDIPLMHDDQHGTAIITGAALLNSLEITKKNIKKVKVVFNGAGPSAISCARLYIRLGVNPKNLLMVDSKGVITTARDGLSEQKLEFARDTDKKDLGDAIKNADVFVGLSRANVLSKEMVKTMAKNPIVFALANPNPEISYKDATESRKDIIMATGRSDHPNQVNNVLGFPFIFRGAMDVRATAINEEMKLAAVNAIANLAKEAVPEIVNLAYNKANITFGPNYIIPKPFDPRLISTVAPAVAKAAMDSGVAKNPILDWDKYKEELLNRLGRDDKFIRVAMQRAKESIQQIVFAEGDNFKVLKAAHIAQEEGLLHPVLLGNKEEILNLIDKYQLEFTDATIIDPREEKEKRERYAQHYFAKRQRKGVTLFEARKLMRQRNYFGPMMVEMDDADGFVTGQTVKYSAGVKPLFEILGKEDHITRVAGMYVMLSKKGPLFFADTTITEEPTTEDIVKIAINVSDAVKRMNIKPKIALLSYSNYGSHKGKIPTKMYNAAKKLKEYDPNLIVDGEMQANFALDQELLEEVFPFSDLVKNPPNIFIFPDLGASNIAYKLLQGFNAAEAIGPMLIGLKKSAHVIQMGSTVREILNIAVMAAVDAQSRKQNKK